MKRMISIRFLKLLLTTILAIACLAGTALANDPTPSPVPIPEGMDIVHAMWSSNTEIILMKDNLYVMGYYPSSASSSDLATSVLDEMSMAAIRRCCTENNLPYSDYGITRQTWDAIITKSIVSLNATPTPAATPESFRHIYYGEESDSVLQVQLMLQKLGYNFDMTAGVYNLPLQEAIEEFCKFNNIRYDRTIDNGITVELQTVLLQGEPVPFSTPAPEISPTPTASPAPGKIEKIQNYFTSTANIGGFEVPQLAIWLISLLLIVAIVALAIHFFMPGEESKSPRSNEPTRKSPRGESLASGKIEFIIEYNGVTQRHRCDIQHSLKIGRGVGDFPLNMDDMRISRKHCELYYLNRNLMLRDYSSNGTLVNGKQCLHGEYMLSNGDVITVGSHKITIIF